MRNGATFPPVILLNDDILVDGNTRITAAKRSNLKVFPAFKCRFPNAELAVAFAAAMNQMGGRRLSADEARGQAEVLIRNGHTDDSISRELGYGRTHVNNWRRENAALDRAKQSKVTKELGTLKAADVRKVSGIKQDAPFAAAVKLIADTNPSAKTVTAVVKGVTNAASEADALQAVADARTTIVPSGPPPHRSAQSAEMLTAKRSLPQVANLAGHELALVETDPVKRDVWVQSWITVRDLAAKVVEAHG